MSPVRISPPRLRKQLGPAVSVRQRNYPGSRIRAWRPEFTVEWSGAPSSRRSHKWISVGRPRTRN